MKLIVDSLLRTPRKVDTSLKRTRGVGPAVLQSFTSSPSKVDTPLRRTVGAGAERVRL